MDAFSYWFATYTWDFINYLIPALVILIMFAAFSIEAYQDDLGVVFLMLVSMNFTQQKFKHIHAVCKDVYVHCRIVKVSPQNSFPLIYLFSEIVPNKLCCLRLRIHLFICFERRKKLLYFDPLIFWFFEKQQCKLICDVNPVSNPFPFTARSWIKV